MVYLFNVMENGGFLKCSCKTSVIVKIVKKSKKMKEKSLATYSALIRGTTRQRSYIKQKEAQTSICVQLLVVYQSCATIAIRVYIKTVIRLSASRTHLYRTGVVAYVDVLKL